MKIQEIIAGIPAYHPDTGEQRACDGACGGSNAISTTGCLYQQL